MTSEHPHATTSTTWMERGIYLALVMACAVALSPNMADADLWGHVQFGLDVMKDGLAHRTTYSYSADGYPWINHENLAELLMASVATWIGGPGLLAMKCALGLLVVGIILQRAQQQRVGMLALCIVVLIVSVNMTYHWSIRPQIFSYTFFALLIAIVSWCFDSWPSRWIPVPSDRDTTDVPSPSCAIAQLKHLWWAPGILFVWTNSHGGFVAGFCILGCYLFCRSIQAIQLWGKSGWEVARYIWCILIVTILATLLNPYGSGLHVWLLDSLGRPRPEIAEWHPPDLNSMLTIPLLLLSILWVVVLLFSRRVLHWSQLVVMSITIWQCYEHQRHVPFFAILFGLWMAPHVDDLLRRFQKDETGQFEKGVTPRMQGVLMAGLVATLLLLSVRLYDRLHELRVERNEFPVAAFQYMADQELSGKLVVTYNWSQYAIAAFCTEQEGTRRMRVGFDGRFRTCYPQEVVDMHFDFVLGNGGPQARWRGPESPPFNPLRVLEHQQPHLVLFSRYQTHAVDVMQGVQDNWVLLYQDELAQLWGRAERYNNPADPHYLPDVQRQISDEPQNGSVPWPALPHFGGTRVISVADDDDNVRSVAHAEQS